MFKIRNNFHLKKSHLVFGFLFLFYLISFLSQRWNDSDENGWKKIIVSDGKGYYAYLTHLFIENDMTFRADEHLYAVPSEDGKYINRFYCGTALLEAPFFFVACGAASILGYEVNGYTEPFAFCLTLSAIFYVLAGFYFIYVLLKEKLGLSENQSLLTVFLFAIGSNILFYATILAVFSHAYSFFAVSAFCFVLHKTIQSPTLRKFFLLGILISLIVVIRPVNGIIIFIVPFFFSNFNSLIDFIKLNFHWKNKFYLFIGGFIPVFIQCLFWYMQTGNWIEWSYKQEGFYFTKPELFRVLFSFRRGLFIYCPLLFLSLIGFWFWWKESKWKSIWLFISLFSFTYIIASWWHWTYGDTFGMRPFNDILPVFIFLFAISIYHLKGIIKKIFLIFSVLFMLLNVVYAYQYTHEIIRYSNMDKRKFFEVFLRVSDKYKRIYGGVNDIPPYAPNGFESIHFYENKFNDEAKGFLEIKNVEFPGGTEFIYPIEKNHIRHIWIEVSLKRKLLTEDGMKDALFVIHTFDRENDTTKLYTTERIKEYPIEEKDQWENITMRIWLPNSFDGGDKVKMYIWNKGKENFFIDDFKINVQLPKW